MTGSALMVSAAAFPNINCTLILSLRSGSGFAASLLSDPPPAVTAVCSLHIFQAEKKKRQLQLIIYYQIYSLSVIQKLG